MKNLELENLEKEFENKTKDHYKPSNKWVPYEKFIKQNKTKSKVSELDTTTKQLNKDLIKEQNIARTKKITKRN